MLLLNIYPTSISDQNIGYGPSLDGGNIQADPGYDNTFHPPAPPISTNKGMEDSTEVLKFDSNFIMAKPGENVADRHVSLVMYDGFPVVYGREGIPCVLTGVTIIFTRKKIITWFNCLLILYKMYAISLV